MKACKPSAHYYNQLIQMLETTADHCLMIGNEIETDMAAKNYGIETFYIDLDNKSRPKPPLADHMGDFIALARFLGIALII
jgi:FMN phosphatase YigB (HAD superfamily)